MQSRRRTPRPHENSASKAWLRALEMTAKIDDAPRRIFPLVIEELGARFGDAPGADRSRSENFSHAGLAARANRYARWALAQGIGKGDAVALLMPNRPEYLAIWLGITPHRRRGGADQHQSDRRGPGPLPHRRRCPSISSWMTRLDPALEGLDDRAPWSGGMAMAFAELIALFPATPLAADESRDVTLTDPALLIYTSGTTGLPKAAFVSHHRVMMWTHWFAGLMDARRRRPALQLPAHVSSASAAWWRPARCCWRAAR